MSTDTSFVARSHEENWLPVLELAVEEVFEIMLGCRVKPMAQSEQVPSREFTAMVGLAGSLCGILTVCCDAKTAAQIAKSMLGDVADSPAQVADALGEICNMIAGNFKNKLAGTDERCLLSVPTVISGEEYSFHSMAEGRSIETVLLFEGAPIVVCLQLQT
ncbi:MAG: chemotaxis protein CheX [Terriglobales bacterium]|jgi:chemotaxis protein CheX